MTSLLQLSNIWLCCPFRVVTLHSIRTTHATTASVPRDTRRPWCVAGSDSNQTIPAGKKGLCHTLFLVAVREEHLGVVVAQLAGASISPNLKFDGSSLAGDPTNR